jgi:hypothetical protein
VDDLHQPFLLLRIGIELHNQPARGVGSGAMYP